MADLPARTEADAPLLVACLCAQWCGTCRDYRAVFDALAADMRDESLRAGSAPLRFVWVDIEDQADALGEVDVEDFPTLLVARDDAVLFFGPLPPQPGTLARLVRSALDGALAAVGDGRHAGLAARVRAL
jgi:thiol-disulfide isomerase/thioredoxin